MAANMQPWEPVLPKGHAAKTRMLKSMLSQWPAAGAYPVPGYPPMPAFVMPPQQPSSMSPPPQPVRETGDKKKRKEWVCKCKTSNWESRSSCRDCGKDRPSAGSSKRQDRSRDRRPAKTSERAPSVGRARQEDSKRAVSGRDSDDMDTEFLDCEENPWAGMTTSAMKAEVVRLQGVIQILKSHSLSVDEAQQKLQKLRGHMRAQMPEEQRVQSLKAQRKKKAKRRETLEAERSELQEKLGTDFRHPCGCRITAGGCSSECCFRFGAVWRCVGAGRWIPGGPYATALGQGTADISHQIGSRYCIRRTARGGSSWGTGRYTACHCWRDPGSQRQVPADQYGPAVKQVVKDGPYQEGPPIKK